jgi:hypothetical protein
MRILECEIVQVVNFPHLQRDYEHELTCICSFERQSDNHQTNFQKVNKTKPKLFDEQEDSLDTYNLAVISEDVQGYMNVFVDMHRKMNKLITAISFENVPRMEEIEQEQQTLMKEAGLFVFVHQEEMIFHDLYNPVACYMKISNNQDLRLKTDCKLKGGDNDKSTSVLDMDCFALEGFLQPISSSDSGGCYFHPSQQIYQLLHGNRQGESHENHNAVEEVKHSFGLIHALEDPFAVLRETINNPNILELLRIKFICNFPKLLVSRFWNKYVQRNLVLDKILACLHWHYDFI